MKTTILLDGIRPPRHSVEADPVLVRSRDTKSAIAKQCNRCAEERPWIEGAEKAALAFAPVLP
jgi:hypothetical protein